MRFCKTSKHDYKIHLLGLNEACESLVYPGLTSKEFVENLSRTCMQRLVNLAVYSSDRETKENLV